MVKKRGLGRGLDALLGGMDSAVSNEVPVEETQDQAQTLADKGLTRVPVDQIHRGSYQPRRHFDEAALDELAASLKSQGMIQPVVLRPHANGYELIAGERRWRAAQLAGLERIPAVINDYKDSDAAAVALIENIQREDLNPLEEASALQRLQDEFGLTHQAVANAVGRSRSAVSNLLRLLELSDEVKSMVDQRLIEMGHARALLSLDKSRQAAVAQKIIDKALSVRATEALIKEIQAPTGKQKSHTQADNTRIDPDIQALIHRLSDVLGSKVQLQHKQNGSGKLEISYTSLDELDGILSHIH